MDQVDPSRIPGFQPPITSEVAAEAKKKLKESKMDKYEEEIEEGDSVLFSETTQQIPEKKREAFMEDAKKEISDLDPNSESFVEDATEKLVNSALKWEFGDKLLGKPEYKQMEAVIKKKIMRDEKYRPIIEDFLGMLLESEQ
jgi:hypothetical protein